LVWATAALAEIASSTQLLPDPQLVARQGDAQVAVAQQVGGRGWVEHDLEADALRDLPGRGHPHAT
jgi:hypothetical protein